MFFSWRLACGIDDLICDLVLLNSLSGEVLIEPGFVLCLFLPETDLYHPLPYFNRLHFPSKARQSSEDHWWGKRLQPWRAGEKETPAWLCDNFWLEMWLDLTREQMSEHLFSLGLWRFSEIWHHITHPIFLPKIFSLTIFLSVLQTWIVRFLWLFWWILWNQAL